MDEKYYELASKYEEQEREAAIKSRVVYNNYSEVCTEDGCGVELPPERFEIGICTDCAEDLERIQKAKIRNGRPGVEDDE